VQHDSEDGRATTTASELVPLAPLSSQSVRHGESSDTGQNEANRHNQRTHIRRDSASTGHVCSGLRGVSTGVLQRHAQCNQPQHLPGLPYWYIFCSFWRAGPLLMP
jgi:hypothetical protein